MAIRSVQLVILQDSVCVSADTSNPNLSPFPIFGGVMNCRVHAPSSRRPWHCMQYRSVMETGSCSFRGKITILLCAPLPAGRDSIRKSGTPCAGASCCRNSGIPSAQGSSGCRSTGCDVSRYVILNVSVSDLPFRLPLSIKLYCSN